MSKRITTEEREVLLKNPYIKSAHSTMVAYTADFKREYITRFDAGESGRSILRSSGIDPDILGDSRIYSLAGKFRKELEQYGGFSDVRRKKGYDADSASIEQLRVEVAYVKQEVEFLKKNMILDSEEQRKGSRKAVPTQNLSSLKT